MRGYTGTLTPRLTPGLSSVSSTSESHLQPEPHSHVDTQTHIRASYCPINSLMGQAASNQLDQQDHRYLEITNQPLLKMICIYSIITSCFQIHINNHIRQQTSLNVFIYFERKFNLN
ncbi:unnamed protein product [Arctogadus glacialis]